MAAFSSIKGSPVAALMHDLRERESYQNPDIDQEKKYMNYTLSPHGETVKECMDQYDRLMEDVYHRNKSTITTGEWVVTAPADLPPEQERAFFERTYEFLNTFHFNGDDSRCLLAQVHYDEGVCTDSGEIIAGSPHLHYIMVMPETKNEKYVSFQDKCIAGLKEVQKHFDIKLTRKQAEDIVQVVKEYEKSHLPSRDHYALHDIQGILGINRDDARWAFTRVRRTASQKNEIRLMSKDEFLTKKMFRDFHPAFQKWIDQNGLGCTVYKGGTGVNFTVKQLKEMTKETGYKLIEQTEYEHMQKQLKTLEHKLEVAEKRQVWGSSEWREEKTWERK